MIDCRHDHIIYGVHVHNRGQNALKVQELLTRYGCNIKTRLGLHEVSEDFCSSAGVLLLEMTGDPAVCRELFEQLNMIDGVEAKEMVFAHT
ncbi:MAG TPA: hypothetical protein PK349_07620 [Candidatus Hydrogenedentes bacterium]|nr:hypothetical protein [Candidatus Hydrogenedentota bacterium]